MQLSPTLAATGTYPFVKLEQAKRRLAEQGVELIDFGKGDPREPTDPMIRQALADSITEISTYPLAEGLPELRGAVAPLDFLERLADLSAEHGFLLASDEAYTELWFDEPPHSALEVRDRGNVAVFNTLSKRSSMTGYRSGFVAAAPDLIAALKQFRPSVGTAPQEFVQRASVVAWNDEEHVERTRAAYRRKREALLPTLARKGIRVAGSDATMYLWLEVPAGESSETFAGRLRRIFDERERDS